MDIAHQLTSIFCQVDDFCNELDSQLKDCLLEDTTKGNKRGPDCCLSDSEIMTLLIMFQNIQYRNFKTYYCCHVIPYWRHFFPALPSYNRFVELMKKALFPMTLFVQTRAGKRTGLYYIDSTSLPVCKLKRSKRNRTFKGIAEYGKTSMGWFFGLKLHLVVNEQGELMTFCLTKGNKHDSAQAETLFANLEGLAFGDKGYISN